MSRPPPLLLSSEMALIPPCKSLHLPLHLHLPLRLRPHPLTAALTLALLWPLTAAQAQTATEAELMRRLDSLAAEVGQLKAQLGALQQQRDGAAAAPTTAPASTLPAGAAAPTAPSTAAAPPATVLTSYAEINYTRPRRASQNAQADLRRFVLGYQHRLDEQTKIVTELEVEHSVSSASDPGEVAVEQAYVEHQLTPTWALRGGLFLMPMGLLNENHEPAAFFGVERNFVETAIIPSTWREGGVQMVGQFDNGLTLQAGVSTGFDLNKWDATRTDGAQSPLGGIHQELALAKARDLALFGALNWRGVPGLQIGGGVFSGGATHGQALASARITLWDLHARWTPGKWDLSALISRGNISNSAALNAVLNAPLVGSATLIPKAFDGGYVQAGYHLWQQGNYALTPFLRWERFNTASGYADLGPGLTPPVRPAERVVTVGANFQLTPGVVVKADWQRFSQNRDADRSSVGLGWSF